MGAPTSTTISEILLQLLDKQIYKIIKNDSLGLYYIYVD